jgi:methyl-accepting chemotaxis protein
LPIKKIIFIVIIFFFIYFIISYFSGRIQIRNLTDRVAEYNRLCEQYKIGESDLKKTIGELRNQFKSESDIAQRAREENKRIQSINGELNKQIEYLRELFQSIGNSSNRIDEYSDRIIEIIQRIQERGSKTD